MNYSGLSAALVVSMCKALLLPILLFATLMRSRDENDWHHGEVIRLLAAMAALFHDFGKANAAFQQKLKKASNSRDAYRHEWVSLRLFVALVGDVRDDRLWLQRLAESQSDLSNWKRSTFARWDRQPA